MKVRRKTPQNPQHTYNIESTIAVAWLDETVTCLDHSSELWFDT